MGGDIAEYGVILTVPVEPPCVYRVEMRYKSKALAKEAVTRLCLEDGILDSLKKHVLDRLNHSIILKEPIKAETSARKTAENLATLAIGNPSASLTNTIGNGQRSAKDWVVQLNCTHRLMTVD